MNTHWGTGESHGHTDTHGGTGEPRHQTGVWFPGCPSAGCELARSHSDQQGRVLSLQQDGGDILYGLKVNLSRISSQASPRSRGTLCLLPASTCRSHGDGGAGLPPVGLQRTTCSRAALGSPSHDSCPQTLVIFEPSTIRHVYISIAFLIKMYR